MNIPTRAIRDQVTLVAAYHFTLALAFFIGGAAIIVYAILPTLAAAAANLPQRLFPPATGLLLCVLLAAMYARIGTGLNDVDNGSRMAAIYLALTGIIGGIFGMVGTILTTIANVGPNWFAVAVSGSFAVSIYLITSSADLIVLFFLMKRDVQVVFYGEEIPQEERIEPRKVRSTNHSKEPVRETA